MRNADFARPTRAWINNPSNLDPHHDLHGKTGIAVLEKHSSGFECVSLHFTKGSTHSMVIMPIHLARS